MLDALLNSGSVWATLVLDAQERDCFFDADENDNLAIAMGNALDEEDEKHCMKSIGYEDDSAPWLSQTFASRRLVDADGS